MEAPGARWRPTAPALVLHRFGGTYGPIHFIAQVTQADGAQLDPIRLTFMTAGGLPFHFVELPVVVAAYAIAPVSQHAADYCFNDRGCGNLLP
jgi:hypothetical protein